MANIKSIEIEGYMAYDASAFDAKVPGADEQARLLLGTLNLPVLGVRIEWLREPQQIYVPSGIGGGSKCFCPYRISGEEAFWHDGLQKWVDVLSRVGVVTFARACDVEERTGWGYFVIPAPETQQQVVLAAAIALVLREGRL